MAFEAGWKVERVSWTQVLDAIRDVAEPYGLRFEAAPGEDEETLRIRVLIPVSAAAELAATLSDFLEADVVAKQLQPPRERPDEGPGRPDSYACELELGWKAPPQLKVSGKKADNRSAWPVVVAFASAFAAKLGGQPIE